MGLAEPTDHGSADVWGALLNAVVDLIDSHNHTAGKGVLVPSAGLKINADVPWSFGGVNYAVTALKALDFTPVAASTITAYSSALFANSTDADNLYYRNSAGTNVKITDGNALNIAIVGGIGGDYTSIGALFSYDDATHSYWARQEAIAGVRKWARLRASDLDIYEVAVTTNRVRLSCPAALAASYALTFPAALPAGVSLVQVSNTGVLTFTNTTVADVTVGALHQTSGKIHFISPAAALAPSTSPPVWDEAGAKWTVNTTTGKLCYPVNVPVMAGVTTKITGWNLYYRKTSAAGTITAGLYYKDQTTGSTMQIGTDKTDGTNNPGFTSFAVTGLTSTLTNGRTYFLVVNGGGTTGDEFEGLEVVTTDT